MYTYMYVTCSLLSMGALLAFHALTHLRVFEKKAYLQLHIKAK